MLCSAARFLGFTGVSKELGEAITSAVRIAPRLVRFSTHATRWNFGEAECSRGRFLVMVGCGEERSRV